MELTASLQVVHQVEASEPDVDQMAACNHSQPQMALQGANEPLESRESQMVEQANPQASKAHLEQEELVHWWLE